MSYAAAVGTQRPRHAVQAVAQESLTATLTASSDVKCLDLLRTIYNFLGPRDITCLQPLGRNQYAISFISDAAMQKAMTLTTTHKVESMTPVNGRTRVRCFNVPPYGDWEPLLKALRVYGTVDDHFQEMYRDFKDIATGCRIVVMKFNDPTTSTTGPLPETLKILGRVIRFDYAGLEKSCFSCRKKGHTAKDCPLKNPQPKEITPPAAPTPSEVGEGESEPSTSGNNVLVPVEPQQPVGETVDYYPTMDLDTLVAETDIHASFQPRVCLTNLFPPTVAQPSSEPSTPVTTNSPSKATPGTPTVGSPSSLVTVFSTPSGMLPTTPASPTTLQTPANKRSRPQPQGSSLEKQSISKRLRNTPSNPRGQGTTEVKWRGLGGKPVGLTLQDPFTEDTFSNK